MYTRTIYLPSIDAVNLTNADAYIRSAFTIPRKATVQDASYTPGVVVAEYYNPTGEMIARFTCYSMRDHK